MVPAGGGLYGALTIDDVAAGDGARLEPVLEWLDRHKLRATFFAIPYSDPNQATLYDDPQLLALLQQAIAAGHEVLPHGYDHNLFECGLPELMAVSDDAMMSKIARTLSREEFGLRHSHTRGMIGARLEKSVKIFEEAFDGVKPKGIRSGYHTFCREFYAALEILGFEWTSTRTAVPGAWRPTLEAVDGEVLPWVGLQPYWVGQVLEIPHLCDYGSHVAPETVDGWVELGRRHLQQCQERGAPFIPVAHPAGLRCSGDPKEWRNSGYAAYDQLLKIAREEFGVTFVPLSEIADRAKAQPEAWLVRDPWQR